MEQGLMLDALVAEYLTSPACVACWDDLEPFATMGLREAIDAAAFSRINGKRHPHQRRLPAAVLAASRRALLAVHDDIAQASRFADLHGIVERALHPIRGAGELYAYDVAHRIGICKKFEPDRVYLHAGTRAGARKLGFSGKSVPLASLPTALLRLTPAQVEDFLCIFKGRIS